MAVLVRLRASGGIAVSARAFARLPDGGQVDGSIFTQPLNIVAHEDIPHRPIDQACSREQSQLPRHHFIKARMRQIARRGAIVSSANPISVCPEAAAARANSAHAEGRHVRACTASNGSDGGTPIGAP
ncbi:MULTISPECIES: hypothetical protein [unclassified Bradyrhizobium]|uniref:Uncharacterized protein n=1 Tax=Bradyrhizobium sp. LLZ17 TaxID=3239388 RepID=A0AB39XJ76_9BRAD